MTKPAAAAPSDRARIRRTPHQAGYDLATVHAILDAGPIPPCQGSCPLLYFSLFFRWAG